MDWIVPADHEDSADLRIQLRNHLQRYARPGEDIAGAELAVGEILTNAVEHAGTRIWVNLDWDSRWPVVTVHDIGPGFEQKPTSGCADVNQRSGRGLMIAAELSRELKSKMKKGGGNSTRLVLDVERDVRHDIDPDPRPVRHGLPRLDEAAPDGYFGRESFLKALTVEVAHAVDSEHGTAAAEQTVATVGATVGRQMESAFRLHHNLQSELSSHQIADLYVGLNSAIGATFAVVSVDDDKIVLENGVCPFGDAVTEAPSLCRMTSSVFGGIAARNSSSDVAVHLEQRIAVGDPKCRVVVYLTPAPDDVEVYVHRYGHRRSDGSARAAVGPLATVN